MHQVGVARKVEKVREFYLGVTVDEYSGTPVVILSTAGGISVEETARTHPEFVISRQVPIARGLLLSEARQMAREVGLDGEDLMQVAHTLCTLYNVFRKYDALVVEINPLVRTPQGTYSALDSKVEIDDASLYRHSDLHFALEEQFPNPIERRSRQGQHSAVPPA